MLKLKNKRLSRIIMNRFTCMPINKPNLLYDYVLIYTGLSDLNE